MNEYESCPHKDYCKIADGCPDNEYHWINCSTYMMFEGILDRQAFKNVTLKRIFREEHGHHREEEI